MKIFETINILKRFQDYMAYSTFKYIQDLLRGLDLPDVGGIQITSLASQNVTISAEGAAVIEVHTVEPLEQISIKTATAPGTPADYPVLYAVLNGSDTEVWVKFPNAKTVKLADDIVT